MQLRSKFQMADCAPPFLEVNTYAVAAKETTTQYHPFDSYEVIQLIAINCVHLETPGVKQILIRIN